jgi:hypothetical protein
LGTALKEFADFQNRGGFVYAFLDFFLVVLADFQTKRHVVKNGHVRIQGVVLENHGDIAILGGNVVHHFSIDVELAAGNIFETGNHAERGCLAAAGRADKDYEFLVLDGDIRVFHRVNTAIIHFVDIF